MTAEKAPPQMPASALPTAPRGVYWEAAIWLMLFAGFVWAMSIGGENGFGWFHQPENSLAAPLVLGGIINGALFWGNAFYAIPQFLERGQWRQFLAVLFSLTAASVVLQAVTQKLIIIFIEPELSGLGWLALITENLYLPPFVIIFSTLYKFARDWTIHQRERVSLHAETDTLKQAVRDARNEMRILASGGLAENFLQIAAGNEKLQIPIGAIHYIKSAGNYVEIVTPEQTYLAYGALKDLMAKPYSERFARIHRSYVVGMEHIRVIKGDIIQLSNIELPIGSVYKRAFLQQWNARAGAAKE